MHKNVYDRDSLLFNRDLIENDDLIMRAVISSFSATGRSTGMAYTIIWPDKGYGNGMVVAEPTCGPVRHPFYLSKEGVMTFPRIQRGAFGFRKVAVHLRLREGHRPEWPHVVVTDWPVP